MDFAFSENDYFDNSVLTKKYRFQLSEYDSSIGFESVEGCDVLWKEGKDLSIEVITKKQRSKKTKTVRTVTETVPTETFFQFFKVPTVDDLDSDNEEEEDEEEGMSKEERLHMILQEDFDIAEELKNKIIPHAVDWFTGKALEYEDIGMDNEDDYDDDDSSSDDDDDD